MKKRLIKLILLFSIIVLSINQVFATDTPPTTKTASNLIIFQSKTAAYSAWMWKGSGSGTVRNFTVSPKVGDYYVSTYNNATSKYNKLIAFTEKGTDGSTSWPNNLSRISGSSDVVAPSITTGENWYLKNTNTTSATPNPNKQFVHLSVTTTLSSNSVETGTTVSVNYSSLGGDLSIPANNKWNFFYSTDGGSTKTRFSTEDRTYATSGSNAPSFTPAVAGSYKVYAYLSDPWGIEVIVREMNLTVTNPTSTSVASLPSETKASNMLIFVSKTSAKAQSAWLWTSTEGAGKCFNMPALGDASTQGTRYLSGHARRDNGTPYAIPFKYNYSDGASPDWNTYRLCNDNQHVGSNSTVKNNPEGTNQIVDGNYFANFHSYTSSTDKMTQWTAFSHIGGTLDISSNSVNTGDEVTLSVSSIVGTLQGSQMGGTNNYFTFYLKDASNNYYCIGSEDRTTGSITFSLETAGNYTCYCFIKDAFKYEKVQLNTQSLTVTAPVTTYTVTFDANGHGTAPAAQTVSQGDKATQPDAPTADGYTFGGWYTEAGCTNKFYFNTAINSNTTLYAQWTANKYTVTFHENGGEGKMTDQGFTYDDEQRLTENAFTRTNALFVGWATSEENANNGVVAYTNGQSVSNLTTTKDGVVNLYAVWATIEITSCSERIKTTGPLELNITYTNIPANYYYRVMIDGTNPCPDKNNTEWISISGSGSSIKYESYETYNFVSGVRSVTVEVYNNSRQKLFHSIQKTFIAEQINNIAVYYNTGNGNILYKDITGVSETFGATVSAQDIITEKGIVGYRFTNWSIISGTIEFDPNINSETVTITATTGGQIIAHFEELQRKTIYLKTVAGTEDGATWYVKYGEKEYPMTELGCTGEYYRGEVPEGTSFQFVSRDASTDIVETKGTDLQYVEGNTLYNLVSLAASGNKIFFNPNTNWLSTNWNDDQSYEGQTPRFAALFDGNTWLDMTDNNDDKIFECVKPSGATKVYFCRMKPNTIANSWNEIWQQTDEQTIPNEENLFTLPANVSLSDWARGGTWSEFADTPVNGEGEWTIFEGATYRITFNQEGASGTTTPGVAYVDAQHNSSIPAIESLPKNTDRKFAGYYTDGETPITNAFGDWLNVNGYISNGKWVKEGCVTLYAHWVEKTPEITSVTLSKDAYDVGSVETVTATPTVDPHSYTGTYYICWKLLDNSGTEVESFQFTKDNNSVSFSTEGLTRGVYTVRASIYDTDCDTGNELSRYDAKFTIVSGYKVTVKYLCGDNVIQASSTAEGHASTPTEITAPEIGGYKFVEWELGDGISSTSDLNSRTISYTAIYDGYLTAKYEKRKLIFLDVSTLPNKDAWTAPHIYLYEAGGYWNDQTGAGGNKGGNYIMHAAMTEVPNTKDIWYYDYEEHMTNFGGAVAFTSNDQENAEHFANCEAIYRTDFSSGTPVFVPASDQTAETKNTTAKYYSEGYWVKYMDGTGYWMIIYNAKGDKELVRREFTSETQRMTMTSIVDLEAEHTYQYEIYRNDGYYYKGGDITYTNSSDYKPLKEANKHSIKTTETGDYTFTLDYSDGNLQIKVQYPGEVGDYRILYTDDVRGGRYKPSDIKKKEETSTITSFFVRPNNNPVLKIQTSTYATENGVSWSRSNNEIYFKPNDLWKSDNARFAAYFYNGSKNEWKELTKNGDIYSCEKPSGYTHVIFVRLNPAGKGDSKKNNGLHWDYKWTQTINLSLPTDGKNFYSLEEGAWRGQIYLKPNSNWTQGDARFAAYFFEKSGENTTKEEWHSMFKEDDGTYWCGIPDGCSKVVFCRMNPAHSDNRWNTNEDTEETKRVWNQTSDLTVPTDGKLLYTVNNGTWDKGGGTWSVGEGTWNKITGSITDLTEELKEKLGEINGDIGKAPDTVYTIHISQNAGTFTIDKVVPYTGNYYIRVDAVDGKWYDYKTNPDNLMTYSSFSESKANSFGEKFSHHKTKWCTKGTNVKFVIANDYSLCISDTLTQDDGNPFGNIDEHGDLTKEANIRFMWNRHTNKVSRAYVAGASGDNTRFLVLKADKTIQNESGQAINNNEVVFKDTQNWLYERTIKVQPGTLVKLIAYYPDENKTQYFRGTDANDFVKDVSAVQILGGSSQDWYTMRVIYDFKTNRLMGAWVPDQNINGTLEIDADIMVIRQHQEDATYITFANADSKLSQVKTVYGVMRFNRWTLNNRANPTDLNIDHCSKMDGNDRKYDENLVKQYHPALQPKDQKSIYERALYFISFPFDVHLSDVFGFGTYWDEWYIEYYDGLKRAREGYWKDSDPNWKYVTKEMAETFVLEANKGYILGLDLDYMEYNNKDFWAHNIQEVELFFPSTTTVGQISRTEVTMPALGEEYECKINRGEGTDGDRRVKDSYWRCIGVPSYANYSNVLTDEKKETIRWQTSYETLPFLYAWNMADNTLTPKSTSKFEFKAMHAYLVQNGGEIHWSAVNATPNQPAAIMAREREEAKRDYEWRLTLTKGEKEQDQTFIRLTDNEQVTTEFDFNQDLAKELNYGRSDIYTLIGYEKAAANSLPFSEQTTVVPLGLAIEAAGDYTIAMPDGTANIGVTLIDTESNTRTNLSAGMEYVVTLNKGDYNNRFFIEISPIQQTPTDIEYVTGDSNSQNSVRKVLIDNILYIVRDGQIFDARGARVK